jgi:hypothetical protein
MSEETFPYDEWVNEALRSVLSRALKQLSERGPIGEHHFFINFDTSHEGVDIPGFLRAQYPEEITIVLQHQFEDLNIDDQGFEVSLSFSGKKSRLKVPFDAVTSFADPSVNFGLQIGLNAVNEALLQVQMEEGEDNDLDIQEQGEENQPTPFAPVQVLAKENDDFYDDDEDKEQEAPSNEDTEEDLDDPSDDDEAPQTAEVIALDAFRKK